MRPACVFMWLTKLPGYSKFFAHWLHTIGPCICTLRWTSKDFLVKKILSHCSQVKVEFSRQITVQIRQTDRHKWFGCFTWFSSWKRQIYNFIYFFQMLRQSSVLWWRKQAGCPWKAPDKLKHQLKCNTGGTGNSCRSLCRGVFVPEQTITL